MYEDFEIFKRDALSCGAAYYPDKSFELQEVEAAFKIYRNAAKGTTLLDADDNRVAFGVTVVGRLALKVQTRKENGQEEYTWVPSDESFPSIDEIMKQNLGILDENTQESSGILATSNWSLLANDAWLLGELHAHTEFHFASPLSWENLWDEEAKRMTVTAREAIGITMHGYQIQKPQPKLEAVAICVDPQKSRVASLTSYRNHVQRAMSCPAMQGFLASLPPAATQ